MQGFCNASIVRDVRCHDAFDEVPVGIPRPPSARRVLYLIIAAGTVSFTSNSWVRKVQKVKGEGKKRIVAVLPPGDDDSPEVLNSVKRGLGLRAWLEGMGHDYIVTAEKDPGTGKG